MRYRADAYTVQLTDTAEIVITANLGANGTAPCSHRYCAGCGSVDRDSAEIELLTRTVTTETTETEAVITPAMLTDRERAALTTAIAGATWRPAR